MGRPKNMEGAERFTYYCKDPRKKAWLKSLPSGQRSQVIDQGLGMVMGGASQEMVINGMKKLDLAEIELERYHNAEMSKIKSQRAQLEAQFKTGQVRDNEEIKARLDMLDSYKRARRSARSAREMGGWLSGPRSVDLLTTCGFKDLEEAGSYLEDEYQKEIRAKMVR